MPLAPLPQGPRAFSRSGAELEPTRMRASAWALVAISTLLLIGVWVRVVMLASELRRAIPAQVRTS